MSLGSSKHLLLYQKHVSNYRKVQDSYVHGVPKKDSFVGDSDALRFAMVCRVGLKCRAWNGSKQSNHAQTDEEMTEEEMIAEAIQWTLRET